MQLRSVCVPITSEPGKQFRLSLTTTGFRKIGNRGEEVISFTALARRMTVSQVQQHPTDTRESTGEVQLNYSRGKPHFTAPDAHKSPRWVGGKEIEGGRSVQK